MLPTPSTSHVAVERIYEPAEDSFLLLDTLSSDAEKTFLRHRFTWFPETNGLPTKHLPPPFVVEIGTGSGVVLSFVDAHAESIFGRSDILTLGVDVNRYACEATEETVRIAEQDQVVQEKSHGFYLGNIVSNLVTSLRSGMVDVLIFNPPYVPTPNLPKLPTASETVSNPSFEDDSRLLSLSYAGGADGMETTNSLLDSVPEILSRGRGCAYILLCAQNQPEVVKQRIRNWGEAWKVETVSSSGKKGGWEKLQIIKIWRVNPLP
jgi:release factor glutamine methyltransferase